MHVDGIGQPTTGIQTVCMLLRFGLLLLLCLYTQAIDALALCDVDGRMFLEMDEEDLAESDELGLDVGVFFPLVRYTLAFSQIVPGF